MWKKEYEGNMSLEELELWDGFDYHISIIRKDNNGSGKCKYLSPSKNWYHGDYLFTIDSAHEEPNIIDCGYSEYPEQHKSFNIIQLDNGHFAAQPNNRVIFYDKSLSPDDMKFPDYKVSNTQLLNSQIYTGITRPQKKLILLIGNKNQDYLN